VIDSNHLLSTILDHLLQLLPAEPAAFKRLDDIGDADFGFDESEIGRAASPGSGMHAPGLQAAS
jgi:hypothetical protein